MSLLYEMLILSYFKLKDGLPDHKGSLLSILPSQAITLANKEVEKVISEKDTKNDNSFFTATKNISICCVVGLPLTEQTSPRTGSYLFLYMW